MALQIQLHLFALTALAFSFQTADGARPAYYSLNDDCFDRTITLPCQTGAPGRFGTMEFTRRPSTVECRVNITLDIISCESFSHYFLYFNVKSVGLQQDDIIEFHEHYRNHPNSSGVQPLDSLLRVKTLSYNVTCNDDLPTSCDQLLTKDFSLDVEMSVTLLTITYVTYSQDVPRPIVVKPLVLDYVVLSSSENGNDLWCPSLKGFVPRKQMCDASDDSDRVVCPSSVSNGSTAELDNEKGSDCYVASTLQGSLWNPECRLISTELLIGIVFLFIAAVVLIVILLIIAQYYRKIWKRKKLVYKNGHITLGTSSGSSSTVAFENQGYAPDATTTSVADTVQLADLIPRTGPVLPMTSPSTVNVLTVVRPPASSLFTIQEEFTAGVTEA